MGRKFKDISSRSNSNLVVNNVKGKSGHYKNYRNKKPQGLARVISLFVKVFVCMMLLSIILLSIVVTGLTVYLMKASDGQLSIKLDRESLVTSGSTVVFGLNEDKKYSPLNEVINEARCDWVDSVPENLKNAVIALEDKNFLKHQGVNWARTATASANFIFHIWNNNQGGSTITQQLVKNIFNDDAAHGMKGVNRKFREMVRALILERYFSKEQIILAYLNLVTVGGIYGNFRGVGIASKLYFDKEVSDLNLAECATIAALIRSPVFYDPIKKPQNNKPRRDKALKNMLAMGKITQDEYEEAVNTPIETVKGKISSKVVNNYQSYFVDAVLNQVVADYMKAHKIKDWDKANEEVKKGGFKIYSTVDVDLQNKLEKLFSDPSNFGCKSFKNKPHAACVVCDFNGNMKACVGDVGKKPSGDRPSINLATDSVFSPGSSIKPFVYGLAIDKDELSYSSIVEDSPVKQVKGRDWPQNFDKKYHGDVTVQYALEKSLNTVPVKIVKHLGVESVCDFLINDLHFSTIYPPSKPFDKRTFESEAMAVGALTKGMKLSELTNAFQIFGNGGYFTGLTGYEKVCNSGGEVILESKKSPKRVIGEDTSVVMNRLLRRVVTHGTGCPANVDSMGIEVVGKTGTSNDEKNLSFIGLVPPSLSSKQDDGRIIGVWIGGSGLMKPAELFKLICSKMFKSGETKRTFDYLNGFAVEQSFCKESGEIATSSCPSGSVETGFYRKSKIPQKCKFHGKSSSYRNDDEMW